MQQFVANNYAKLPGFLADAAAWNEAPSVAADEDVTDWALLCLAARMPALLDVGSDLCRPLMQLLDWYLLHDAAGLTLRPAARPDGTRP